MRTLLTGGVLAILVFALSACGGSSGSSASEQKMQEKADTYQISHAWLKSEAWQPTTHWLSDHPAYKLKVTVDGDRGTLHFECHFINVDTGKVAKLTAGNLDVARIDGRWRITNFVGSTSELTI